MVWCLICSCGSLVPHKLRPYHLGGDKSVYRGREEPLGVFKRYQPRHLRQVPLPRTSPPLYRPAVPPWCTVLPYCLGVPSWCTTHSLPAPNGLNFRLTGRESLYPGAATYICVVPPGLLRPSVSPGAATTFCGPRGCYHLLCPLGLGQQEPTDWGPLVTRISSPEVILEDLVTSDPPQAGVLCTVGDAW